MMKPLMREGFNSLEMMQLATRRARNNKQERKQAYISNGYISVAKGYSYCNFSLQKAPIGNSLETV